MKNSYLTNFQKNRKCELEFWIFLKVESILLNEWYIRLVGQLFDQHVDFELMIKIMFSMVFCINKENIMKYKYFKGLFF